jgi:hypothetical protein
MFWACKMNGYNKYIVKGITIEIEGKPQWDDGTIRNRMV